MKLYQSNYNWYNIEYVDSKSFKKLTPSSKLNLILNKKIPIHTKNYHEALKFNAHAVADYVKQPLNILLSGGVDSEVIIRVNRDLGIKQNVYTFRFENDLNIRDVESAIDICKNLNIPLKIIDFDVSKFFENDAESYYNKTFFSRVEALPRLKWHEFFDGPLIFGDGEPYLRRMLGGDYNKKSIWKVVFFEYDFINYLYTLNAGNNIIRPWYHFTPEIHGNFLKIDLVQNLIDDQYLGKQSSLSSKVNINRQVCADILTKPKLVGYEGRNDSPGYIPHFMKEFRDNIMKDIIESDIYFDLDTFYESFK